MPEGEEQQRVGEPAVRAALGRDEEARVDIEVNGLALHPSAPAVPRAEARRLGIT
jgi:hypothetical protein